jgi:hypothetical protein
VRRGGLWVTSLADFDRFASTVTEAACGGTERDEGPDRD